MVINPELIEKFAEGRGVLFVGAGLSMGAGLKGWGELMKPLRDDIRAARVAAGRPVNEPDELDDLSPLALAQAHEDEMGRLQLIEMVRKNLPPLPGGPTDVHAALFRLPVEEIYTTNFDDFIEVAARAQQRTCHPIIRPGDADVLHAESPDGRPAVRVVKVHGDYKDPEGIVISQLDYDNVWERKETIWLDMEKTFRSKTVLFLGYSFNDPDLQELLQDVRTRAGRFPRKAYAVLLEVSHDDKDRLNRLGIQPLALPIRLSQTVNEALAEWLNEFAAKVAEHQQRRHKQPSQPIPNNLPEMIRPLIGRDEELGALLPLLESEGGSIALRGAPGVGKTTLALKAAHDCANDDKLFDCVVWVQARELSASSLLRSLLTAVERTTGHELGLPSDDEGGGRLDQLFKLMKDHRLLIVIDHPEPWANSPNLTALLEGDLGLSRILVTGEASAVQGGATLYGFSAPGALQFLIALLRGTGRRHPLDAANKEDKPVEFANAFNGNPMLIKLAFHLVKDDDEVNAVISACSGLSESRISDLLHEMIWDRLQDDSRELLSIARIFAIGTPIDGAALYEICRMGLGRYEAALEDCLAYGLVEVEPVPGREFGRVRAHPITLNFIDRHVRRTDPAAEASFKACQRRIIDYYRDLVHRQAMRLRPRARYWNALVTGQMRGLDWEWPNIKLAAKRCAEAADRDEFVEFVMLLVHYMDSRLYNNDRLRSVRLAIDYLTARQDWEGAALLHIDALAWTFMEQGRFGQAVRHIKKGLACARKLSGESREDLEALGKAWRARLAVQRTRLDRAKRLADQAMQSARSPWITARAMMVAGDVALRRDDGAAALTLYEEALSLQDSYGSEGDGYDLLPRIGLAYLKTGQLGHARAAFTRLGEASGIGVARLYSEYGLGLADHQTLNISEARKRIAAAERELVDRRSRMMLIEAFRRQYNEQSESHRQRLRTWICLGQPPSDRAAAPNWSFQAAK